MKKILVFAICISPSVITTAPAALLASYVDGTAADSAALVDLALNGDVTVTTLQDVGFQGGSLVTRSEFGTPVTPDNGAGAGTEWLFARATYVGSTPTSSDDYFGFTVTADSGDNINLTNFTFDLVNIRNGYGTITTSYEIFASIDGGSFASYGSGSVVDGGAEGVWGTIGHEDVDLSSITGASSVEIRLALGDDSSYDSKASWVQNIQLHGEVIAVPEASSAVLMGLCGCGALLLRRRQAYKQFPVRH